jgi:drug/metabolite transporter (DMT)-like permease
MLAAILISVGSLLIAFLMTWQVKYIQPQMLDVLKYNAYILLPMWVANSALGMGFIIGHSTFKNFTLVVAGQTFVYYCFLVIFSYFLLGERPDFVRLILGFSLIISGIYVLKY